MTSFNDRENAFENKYAHDADMLFKAMSRRNRLVGLWAAGLLGRTGDEADAYAREVVRADFAEAGDDDVLRKLEADLKGHADRPAIRARMDAALVEAQRQLMGEAG